MYRRQRGTLRLQLTFWFVVALLAVESTVLFGYWVAREEPLIATTSRDLHQALEEVRTTAEQRDFYLWRREELASLAIRADVDLLCVVTPDGTTIAGEDAAFPPSALSELLANGTATWTLAAVDRADPQQAQPEEDVTPPDGATGDEAPAPRGPHASGAQPEQGSSVLKYPEWPVVGAALGFSDVYGRRAYLIGARAAPAAAPPLLIRAVTWMGLIGLFSATVAAWVVLGRALRPLLELAESARRITPEHRDERLSAGGWQSEVEEARHALNEALDRLEAGYDALDLFIGNVTHELRTPIAAVLAEARQLALRTRSTEDYTTFVKNTGDEMARLAKMIQSFLTLARMDWEERRGVIVPVPLLDIAVDVAQHMRVVASQQSVSVVLQLEERTDIEVEGDPDLITSMLENVVRNAVRFSPEGGDVSVAITADEQVVHIAVRDHGPGIPESLIEAAREPNLQARTTPNNGGPGRLPTSSVTGRGSGIGLAIAQKVVELHRGTIHIGNHVEGGCEVIMTLPLKATESTTDLPAPTGPRASPEHAERPS
jgi:signal transduction histidine kinase